MAASPAVAVGNIVPLPTAAKRKVRQQWGKPADYQANKSALPQFPTLEARFEASPYTQECRRQAGLMLDSGEAAIMQMALAVMSAMDEGQRASIMGRLIALGALTRPGAEAALAWVKYEAADTSHKRDIDAAALFIAHERGDL